ncbi:MAG: D-alanyl-D-alanine carboxypeptidase [Zetaproteobacteria bacterium]|nr:MAG: D-alanyl-D-alanine carboxypeptidase [Zetaproteobacteria bacterium]
MLKENQKNSQQKKISSVTALRAYVFIFFCLLLTCISTNSYAKQSTSNEKYAAFVMDADTGLILHRENSEKILHPASLTKMMTLLMVFDALDHGAIRLHSRIRISQHAANMIPSKLGLKPGSTIKVKDAIYALSTKSANDIAVAIAEKLGGTEKNFARMMTKKARTLGMKKTRFKNASGLHDPRQVSTARDMARLGRILVTKYKKHYHYFSKKSFTYQGKTYRSHNRLMDTYTGMDGLKTGYIRQSGFNLVASAVRNDRRLIGVVFGGKTGKSRNAQMKKLLDNAFTRIGAMRIAKNAPPIPHKKPDIAITVASLTPALNSTPLPQALKTERYIGRVNISRWAMLSSMYENSMFNRMIGQGDYDIAVRNRIETGLIAISAHMNERIPSYIFDASNAQPIKMASIPKTPKTQSGTWAIQIGAFTSRDRTDKAIIASLNKLPSDLRHGRSTIAPLQTKQGWIFRGRLHGYTKITANDACRVLNDCIPIAPHAYQ